MADMADDWHLPLHHIKGLDLSGDTAQTTGMRRFEAISGATVGSSKLWMGRTHVSPSTASGIHHHGEAETGIYIVSGTPVFTFLNDGEMVEYKTEPGDYIFVPPWIPHQETNPDPDIEAVVVIARSTQEGIVVNVDSFAWRRPES
jgi:uncharacterized RmlC-like cupin family protein